MSLAIAGLRPAIARLKEAGYLEHQCPESKEAVYLLSDQPADFYRGLLVGCNLFAQAIKGLPVLVQLGLIEEINCLVHVQIFALQQLDANVDANFPDSIPVPS